MYSNKYIAKIVGLLFIAATITSSLSIWLTEPVFEATNFLEMFSDNSFQIVAAAFLMLIDAISVVFIAILLFPILKKKSESLALGYVGMRIMEGILFAAYVVILLTVLSISKEYSASNVQDAGNFKPIGQSLLILAQWAFDIGLGIVFTISALILNYILFRFTLVPRWLSAWGILGALITMTLVVLKFYDIQVNEVLDFTIGIQEMVFAIWLIVKGLKYESPKAKVLL
ncbi:DUF4386 domain-containing protein [Maribacter sp. HTCC2170]|uniref:DUF4386 domain-containing protein n=1 Tax=Maribacter sp. (strain HTCC2170 / KCCM 42371) TaxID=313603 RepID=UPI00006AFD00|nr:DUF4386 domain-containing protein [Maribacter sp. HTCC2170]EAR01314.1 hypothetical protein FB2170_11356 [Maribacter sp. HTCC2170]